MEIGEIDREEWRSLYRDLSVWTMPFGRYQDRLIVGLPEEYLMWFKERGFPTGRLGELMACVYEVKMAGAEEVFAPILKQHSRG